MLRSANSQANRNHRNAARLCLLIVLAVTLTIYPLATLTQVQAKTDVLTDMKGHWAEQQVVMLYLLGHVRGYSDKTFRPERTITRAEVASMFARAFSILPTAPNSLDGVTEPFVDVPSGHWAFASIVLGREKGYFLGDDNGRFRPDQPMTRAEFFAVSLRALGWQNIPVTSQLSETFKQTSDREDIPDWAVPAMQRAMQTGLAKGYEDNTIRANEYVTRAEAVAVLYRMLDNQGRLFALHGTITHITAESIGIGTEPDLSRHQIAVPVPAGTIVFYDGRRGTFDDIRVGDRAAILVSRSGDVRAISIHRGLP